MEKKTLLHAERDKKSAKSGVLMAISITIKQKRKKYTILEGYLPGVGVGTKKVPGVGY